VAPIVLKDKVGEWFEESFESPYMLHAFKIKKCKQDEVAAIAHSDGQQGYRRLRKVVFCTRQ